MGRIGGPLRYLLGFDIGTYSSKGVLVDEHGSVVASHAIEHALELVRPGWAEHDAEAAWWHGFLETTKTLLLTSGIPARQIVAVGLSAISPAVLPIDRHGMPLRKAILYGIDTRATSEAADLQVATDEDPALAAYGVRFSAQSAAPKVLWIRRNEPDVWKQTRQVVCGSGFLLHRLTGENTLDVYSAVSYAPFVDADALDWRPEVEDYVADRSILPRLTWTCEVAGRISKEGAQPSGLAEGTPIITGTADAAAEAISAGLAHTGDLMVMYGSSIFLIQRTSELRKTTSFWSAPFLERNTFVLTGGMATGGSLTRWFRDQFAPIELQVEKSGEENAYVALARLAETAPPGSNGLVMLPYFAGERTPLLDPLAKGVLFGLGLGHTRADVYRALLEGVGFGIAHNLELMREVGSAPTRILAVGGGSRNKVWMQIVSDICNVTQHIPDSQLGASYGDAFLAGVGVGMYSGISEVKRWVRTKEEVRPDPAAHSRYLQYYPIYRELYKSTADLMHRISAIEIPEEG